MLKPSFSAHLLAEQIDRARHHQFMKEALPHLIGGMITAVLVYFIYRQYSVEGAMLVWLSSNLVLLACTIVFYFIYYKKPNLISIPKWGQVTFIVSALWGICWALPPFIFLNTDQALYIAVMLVVIVALSTSPAPAMVYYPSSYYVFITLPLASLFYKLTTLNVGGDFIMLMLTPFLWVSLLGYGWGLHGTMINSIKLRLENEQAWKEAEQANIAKSQFLAAASHDIRQPLQAINLFLSALKNRNRQEEDQVLYQRLEASVDSMSELLNSLLDVSKLDAQVIKAKPQHISLDALLQKIYEEQEPLALKNDLALQLTVDGLTAYADPVLLERVLNNLLTNAVRYTLRGHVDIVAETITDELIRIDVKDTGIGIPSHEQETIFSEFYQLANPERDKQKGLGLGLAIVKRLCHLQSWEIELQSEEGKGSCFSILIPTGDERLISTRKEIDVSINLDNTNVLVIDDEESIQQGLVSLLESWGCTVKACESGDQAQSILEGNLWQPQLIISDYRLRDNRTGVQAIEQVRQVLGADVEAFLITGDTDPQRIQEAKASGLTVLHKPVKPAQLRAVIQRKLKC